MKYLSLFVFLILFELELTASLYCSTSSDDKFGSGDESAALCVAFHGMTENQTLFYFSTEVDEYTLVGLGGSSLEQGSSLWDDNVKISFEAGGKISENRTVRWTDTDDSTVYAVTQIGIVIIVDEGKIDKLTWDDGCFTCSGTQCLDDSTCSAACGTNDSCDLKIYVSWYGTDKHGEYLLSAGQRLSQFQSNTASDYYDSVEGEADTLVSTASSLS